MPGDDPDVLTVLKAELQFLEKGGYRHSPHARWRPQFIFEDSPTCLNYRIIENPRPCRECILMHFVPDDCRGERVPCRHIPLTFEGFTIDTYYRLGTQEEVEAAVAAWLREAIKKLERERVTSQSAAAAQASSGAQHPLPENQPHKVA